MSTVKLPQEDRPLNKAQEQGIENLTMSELLSLLLGPAAYTVNQAATAAADQINTWRGIFEADDARLLALGFDRIEIARIRAAAEIGKRFRLDEAKKTGLRISASADAANLLMPRLRDLQIEKFIVLFFDTKNRLIMQHEAAAGTVDRAFPITREIIREGLRLQASSMICAHNHPSGDPAPSREDLAYTRELSEAGKLMQIRLLDHVIIGNNRYYSAADEGEI